MKNKIFQIRSNIINFLIILFSLKKKNENEFLTNNNYTKIFEFLKNSTNYFFQDPQLVFLFFGLLNLVISFLKTYEKDFVFLIETFKKNIELIFADQRISLIFSKLSFLITQRLIEMKSELLYRKWFLFLLNIIHYRKLNNEIEKINHVKSFVIILENIPLNILGIIDKNGKKECIIKLQFIINNFRQKDEILFFEILYNFSILNPEDKQIFDYQRKILDSISNFYILLEKSKLDKKQKKQKEKKFFILIKYFCQNYLSRISKKIRIKLWLFCLPKLLIMKDNNIKEGFICVLGLMTFLILELEEEIVKSELNLVFFFENFVTHSLMDNFCKGALWNFFCLLSSKSKDIANRIIKLCLFKLGIYPHFDKIMEYSNISDNEEFYLGLLNAMLSHSSIKIYPNEDIVSVFIQYIENKKILLMSLDDLNGEAVDKIKNDKVDEEKLDNNLDNNNVHKIENNDSKVNLEENIIEEKDMNISLHSTSEVNINLFSNVFCFIFGLAKKGIKIRNSFLNKVFDFFLDQFKTFMSKNFSTNKKLQGLFLYIFKCYLILKSKNKTIKKFLILALKEVFPHENFESESLVMIGKIIKKLKTNEIYLKEIVILYFSKIYGFLIRKAEFLNYEILSHFQPYFLLDIFENQVDGVLIENYKMIEEMRFLKGINLKEGFFNNFFSKSLLRWNKPEKTTKNIIFLLKQIIYISSNEKLYLDINKKKKILMDLLKKSKKKDKKQSEFINQKNKAMIILLSILIYRESKNIDPFIYDALNDIFQSSLKYKKNKEIVLLSSQLGGYLFYFGTKDMNWLNSFLDNLFNMLSDLENLDVLSGIILFSFKICDDEFLEHMKLVILNVIIKILRGNFSLGKRFFSILTYKYLGTSKIFNQIFKQSLLFLYSSFLENPSSDFVFSLFISKAIKNFLNKKLPKKLSFFENKTYVDNEKNKKVFLNEDLELFSDQELGQMTLLQKEAKSFFLLIDNKLQKILIYELFEKKEYLEIPKLKFGVNLSRNKNVIKIYFEKTKKNKNEINIEYMNFLCKIFNSFSILQDEKIKKIIKNELKFTIFELVKTKKITLSDLLMILEKIDSKKKSEFYYPYTSTHFEILILELFLEIFENLDLKEFLNKDIISIAKKLFDFFCSLHSRIYLEILRKICFEHLKIFIEKFSCFDERGNFTENFIEENLSATYSAQIQNTIKKEIKKPFYNLEILEDIIYSLKLIFKFTHKTDLLLLKGSHRNLYEKLDRNLIEDFKKEDIYKFENIIVNQKNFIILNYFLNCFYKSKEIFTEEKNNEILNGIFQVQTDEKGFFNILSIFFSKITKSKTDNLFFKNNPKLRFFEFQKKKIEKFIPKLLLTYPYLEKNDIISNKDIFVSFLPDNYINNILKKNNIDIKEKFEKLQIKLKLYKKFLIQRFSEEDILFFYKIIFNNLICLNFEELNLLEKDIFSLLFDILNSSKKVFKEIFLKTIEIIFYLEDKKFNPEIIQNLRMLILELIFKFEFEIDENMMFELTTKIIQFIKKNSNFKNLNKFCSYIKKNKKITNFNRLIKYHFRKIINENENINLKIFILTLKLINMKDNLKEKLILTEYLYYKTNKNIINECLIILQKEENNYLSYSEFEIFFPIFLNNLNLKNEDNIYTLGLILVIIYIKNDNNQSGLFVVKILDYLDLKKQKDFIMYLLKSNVSKKFVNIALGEKYQILLDQQKKIFKKSNRLNRKRSNNPPRLKNLRIKKKKSNLNY